MPIDTRYRFIVYCTLQNKTDLCIMVVIMITEKTGSFVLKLLLGGTGDHATSIYLT